MRGETELLVSDLDGSVERIAHPPIDKERAELEDFADAIAAGRKFVIAPEEVVNGVAAMQADCRSRETRQPVKIAPSASRFRPSPPPRFGAPNSAEIARAALVISSRISATCSSLARIVGVDALIPPMTVPA